MRMAFNAVLSVLLALFPRAEIASAQSGDTTDESDGSGVVEYNGSHIGALVEGPSCETASSRLFVRVIGTGSGEGLVIAQLWGSNAKVFLEDGQARVLIRVKALPEKTTVCFPIDESGTYAISLYYDKDGDLSLNGLIEGTPTEGYGFSNDPMLFGPPLYDDVSFVVDDEDTLIDVTLN